MGARRELETPATDAYRDADPSIFAEGRVAGPLV